MLPKKYLIVIFGLVFIGSIIGLTWFGGPTDPTVSDNETEIKDNGNDSDLVGIDATKLPAGVNVDGIVTPSLIEAHQTSLDDARSYTLTITTHTTVNNTTTVQRTTYQKGPNGVRAVTSVDGNLVTERYSDFDNGTIYERRVGSENDEYSIKEGRTLSASNHQILTAIFNGGAWQPRELDNDSERLAVTLRSNSVKNANPLTTKFAFTSIDSFNGGALVTDDGFIRDVTIRAGGESDGNEVTVMYESKLQAINRTVVTRPDWTKEADEETATSWVGMSGDRRSIYVSHRGGQTFKAGTTLDVYVDEGDTYSKRSTTLSSEFSENETLYLTMVDGELQVYEDTAPDQQGDELTDEAYYIEFTPPDESDPVLEFEVRPPDR